MDLPSFNSTIRSATLLRWQILQTKVNESIQKNNISYPVDIVASTRGLMADPVLEACEAGVTHFAEDYLPEGITKKPVITHRFPNTTWHFTGVLQPNKLHLAVEFFDWIHIFDRTTLVKPLVEACQKHEHKKTKLLIEINPLGHFKKHGATEKDLAHLCEEISKIKNIQLAGFSCRSELMISPSQALSAYEKTAQLHRKFLKEGVLPANATTLALGSSRDFEKAIEFGSTMIRVGSSLFGKSAPSKALLPVDDF